MRILFLGSTTPGQTSHMRYKALKRLGHDVVAVDTGSPWKNASWLARQLGRRLQISPVIRSINQGILSLAMDFKPDWIWGEKQEFLRASTIERLRVGGAKVIHFTPDPYFFLKWKRTKILDESMSLFDALVYCKVYEKLDYERVSTPSVYMPLGFCDEVHRPIVSDEEHWQCDVGFLGGWDPRREESLSLLANGGIDLKIWGGYWDFLADGRSSFRRKIIMRQLAGGDSFEIAQDEALSNCLRGGEVYGDDYALALSNAKIGVGFLRTVWPDQHTTRTFEIPACCSMLLADRTEEHQAFFKEGVEAEFFSSKEELLDKVRFYVKEKDKRSKIAQAGMERCHQSRYAYVYRLADAIAQLQRAFS